VRAKLSDKLSSHLIQYEQRHGIAGQSIDYRSHDVCVRPNDDVEQLFPALLLGQEDLQSAELIVSIRKGSKRRSRLESVFKPKDCRTLQHVMWHSLEIA